MLEALIDAGIVRDTGVRHPAGWIQVPEVELLVQRLLADELGYEPSEATVKEHSEYRGQAQTVIQRIAVLED